MCKTKARFLLENLIDGATVSPWARRPMSNIGWVVQSQKMLIPTSRNVGRSPMWHWLRLRGGRRCPWALLLTGREPGGDQVKCLGFTPMLLTPTIIFLDQLLAGLLVKWVIWLSPHVVTSPVQFTAYSFFTRYRDSWTECHFQSARNPYSAWRK